MSRARLSLDLDQQTKDRIEALVKETQSSTITDTIKQSIALLEAITAHTKQGGKVVLRHKDGTEDVILFLK